MRESTADDIRAIEETADSTSRVLADDKFVTVFEAEKARWNELSDRLK